ncbi:hypothetical protein OG379_14890 [Streptomyces sp. NBC_01166]|uniref:hypothetical protein n=1 Tax=Streptomyces sp. NBC_01166 TaxID=2903755 RepID=UPI00386B68DB|nr:hypothetical protein OG379_14890 [Streptomyces sp. NBC_01166]
MLPSDQAPVIGNSPGVGKSTHLRYEEELTRRVLARSPWRLLTVDAGTLGARESADHTLRLLAGVLGDPRHEAALPDPA